MALVIDELYTNRHTQLKMKKLIKLRKILMDVSKITNYYVEYAYNHLHI